MALQPDARHRNSLGPEPAHQLEGAAPFSSVLECVVVVIELRVGIGLVGEPERLREVVLTEDREPRRPSQRAVVVQRLVDHVPAADPAPETPRSEEHTSELQSQSNLVCRLLLEKKKSRIKSFATTLSD